MSERTKAAKRCMARSHGICEICRCCKAVLVHHKKGRVGPDVDDLENLMALCNGCHLMVHDSPKMSYQKGYMIRRTGTWTTSPES
jgi:hypothetical protein